MRASAIVVGLVISLLLLFVSSHEADAKPSNVLMLDPQIVNSLTGASCAPSCDLTDPTDLLDVANSDGDGDGHIEPADFVGLDIDSNELKQYTGELWIVVFLTNDDYVTFDADEGIFASTLTSSIICDVYPHDALEAGHTWEEDCDGDGNKGDGVVVDLLLGAGVATPGSWNVSAWQSGVTRSVGYTVVAETPPTPTPTITPTSTSTPVPPTPTPTPTRPPGVGGAVLLPPAAIAAESIAPTDDSGWSAVIWAAVAGVLGATALAVAVWRARRRRLR